MRILRIVIKNLASIEGEFCIDFTAEPLISAGIFAITGPTGAGKTTILDAICLALYANTPRFSKAKKDVKVKDVSGDTMLQSDIKGILREGSADGFAEVEFIGTDGDIYRSRWTVRRAHGNSSGKFQGDTITLTNVSKNLPVNGSKDETKERITQLVGLKFNQFTRSVMLAQGEFTAFLKSDNNDKSELLENLTGTEIYSEISQTVHARNSEEASKLKELNNRLSYVQLFSEEEKQQMQDQKVLYEKALSLAEQNEQKLNSEFQWFELLFQLEKSLEESEKKLNVARNNKDNFKERAKLLDQLVSIQSVSHSLKSKTQTENNLSELKSTCDILSKEIIDLESKEKELKQLLESNRQKELEKKELKDKAIPLISEANRLDALILEKNRQLNLNNIEINNKKEDILKLETEISKLNETELNLNSEIEKTTKWFESKSDKKEIAVNSDLIVHQLNNSLEIVKNLQESLKKKEQAELRITEIENSLDQLYKNSETLEKNISKENSMLVLLKKDFDEEKYQGAVKEKEVIQQYINELNEGYHIIKRLKSDQETLINLQKKLEEDQIKKQGLSSRYVISNTDFEKAEILKNNSLSVLNKAKLLAAESIENLRNNLKEEEECPVCGSLEHPYREHSPVADLLLSELEKDYHQKTEDFNLKLSQKQEIDIVLKNLSENIENQHKDEENLKILFEENFKNWKLNFNVKLKFEEEINVLDIAIQNRIDEFKNIALTIKDELNKTSELKNQIEKQEKNLNDLKNNYSALKLNIASKKGDLGTLVQIKTSESENINNYNFVLERTKIELIKFFKSDNWFENLKSNPDNFISQIISFSNDWKLKKEKLEFKIDQLDKIYHNKSAKNDTFIQINKSLKTLEEKNESLEKEKKSYLENRKRIFDGASTDKVLEILDEELNKAEQEFSQCQKKLSDNSNNLTEKKTKKESIYNQIDRLTKELKNTETDIEEWLQHYNSNRIEPLQLEYIINLIKQYDTDWINKTETELKVIEKEYTEELSVYNDRKSNLEKHSIKKLSEKTYENLKIEIGENSESLKKSREQHSKILVDLKENSKKEQMVKSFQNDIDKQFKISEQWKSLHELIGSKDGKKFREIAQQYTLDMLLVHANHHLGNFSKRYIIQRVPNSLGLQVIDKDMGYDIRTIYSLSGGESFIVSLALALGLSSLNADKVRVETLFIDEGFGSLDPKTLATVMDALSQLQQMGRKVGVISHVQEMMDSIPVQIRVLSLFGGKSKIEVV